MTAFTCTDIKVEHKQGEQGIQIWYKLQTLKNLVWLLINSSSWIKNQKQKKTKTKTKKKHKYNATIFLEIKSFYNWYS